MVAMKSCRSPFVAALYCSASLMGMGPAQAQQATLPATLPQATPQQAGTTATPDSRADISGLTYLNNNTLPTGFRFFSDSSDTFGSLVGGLSGIDYDARTGRFVAVRDNWMPNAGAWGVSSQPNFFDLTARTTDGKPGYALDVTGVHALDVGGRTLMSSLESVRHDPDGDGLWFVSEDRGSIFHWTSDDNRREIRLADNVVGQSGNAGLEGLAFTPSGGLWVAREGTRPGDPGDVSLLTNVDRDGKVLGQFAYRRDAMANNGVSEMIALSDTSFLVMERAWDGKSATSEPKGVSHNSIRVYRVDLARATDVKGLATVPGDGSVEFLSKTLVFDSATLAGTLNSYETKVDNIEGMTFGPRLTNGHATMVMVSDNNNSGSQGKTQFIVFKVDSPIPDVQWWDGEGPMADGSIGGSGVWRAKSEIENWSRSGGWVNDRWNGRTAVFGGKSGTVTIDPAGGAVSAKTLAFRTDGYRIDGGALTLDGGMTIDVGDTTRIGLGREITATITAPMTGTGDLDKTGAGTLRFTGNGKYGGDTLISAGTLALDGMIAGRVRVGRDALLTGTGTAGSATIEEGGTLNAGTVGAIGILGISGNLAFAPGSRFQVDLDAEGRSDLVKAGSVTIGNGARITLNPLGKASDGSDWNVGRRYSVIETTGGVTGRFAGVDEGFAYLTAFAEDGANSVSVRLDRSTMPASGQDYVRDVLVRQYDDLRKDHPELATVNLAKVRSIMAEASPERRQLAIWDNTNYAMTGMADRARGGLDVGVFGPIAGEHGNPFMNAGINSPGQLHEFGKSLSNSVRPCNIPVARGGVQPLFGCSGSSSYPSGHTAKATGAMALASYIFPERMQSFLNRAQEYGESRIVAGQHFPLDVMASRGMTYKVTADLFAAQVNDSGSWLNTWASPEAMRKRQIERCGTVRIAICAAARTDTFSVDTREDYLRNRAYYLWTSNYGFPSIGATDLPMEVPDNAEYLIMTRYPYLDRTQLREILRTTAFASGGVLSDPWSRINLFDAGEGFGAFNADVTVTMDVALAADDTKPGAGFNAADRWRNDIGGKGRLTKAGSGALTLAGDNSFGGFTVTGGSLILTRTNALGGSAVVENGLLALDGGTLRTQALTVARTGSLRLNDGSIRTDATLDLAGTTDLGGRNRIELIDAATGRISGALRGSGLLEKAGGGTLTLSGEHAYAGSVLVSGGTMLVDGRIGGRFDVASGAVLGGSGTIGTTAQAGDVRIANGGILDPGNGLGTLAINGNVAFADGAIYRANVNAIGRSNLLDVTGKVSIDRDAIVAVNALDRSSDGFDYALSTRYRILGASGGVTGTFGKVTENFAYLDAALGYDASGVYLTLTRSGTTADPAPRPDNPILATDMTISSAAGFGTGSGPVLLGRARIVSTAGIDLTRDVRVAPEGSTLAQQADTTLSLSGAVSGPGTLTKTGAGTLRLTGTSTAAGDLRAENGLLRVDGTFTGGTTTISDGAMLAGTGRLCAVRIGSSGILMPGASIGTLDAASYSFDAGSVYRVEVNAKGQSDLIRASGTVTINGGARVTVGPEDRTEDGSTYAVSTRYTIVTAQGGVAGRFGGVTDSFAYLTPSLTYDPGNVYLTLDRVKTGGGVTRFSSAVSTRNRKAVADAVEALGKGNAVYEAALYLPDGYPEGAFEQLTGEVHSAVGTALIDLAAQNRRILIDRTRSAMGGVMGGTSAPAAVAGDTTAFWLNGVGAWNRYDADGNGNRLSANSAGMLAGLDAAIGDHGRIGVAGGWTRTDLRTGLHGTDTARVDSYNLAAFGGAAAGAIQLRGGANFSRNDIRTDRSVTFPRFAETLRGDYRGSTAQGFAEGGWRIDLRNAAMEPYIGVTYVRYDAATVEAGGSAALENAGEVSQQIFSTAGIRLDRAFNFAGVGGQLSAGSAWQHAYGDRAAVRTLRFAGGSRFDVASTLLAQDTALFDVSVAAALSQRINLSLSYNGGFGGGQTSTAANARITMRF